jgi:hypothetical protein
MFSEDIRLVHGSSEREIDSVRRQPGVDGAPVPIGGRAFELPEPRFASKIAIQVSNDRQRLHAGGFL